MARNGPDPQAALAGLCAEVPAANPRALGEPLFYWAHPEAGVRVAAFGELLRRETGPEGLPALFAQLERPEALAWLDGPSDARPRPPGPWFGAVAFDLSRRLGGDWEGFGAIRWSAPELLLFRDRGRQYAAAFALAAPGAAEALRERLEETLQGARRRLEQATLKARPLPESMSPGSSESGSRSAPTRSSAAKASDRAAARAHWSALVGRALKLIDQGELSKVVLARAVEVEAAAELSPSTLLEALERRHPSCRTFLLRGDGGGVFVAATPELFCQIEGRQILTEALAGSARPGEVAALLASPKERREHGWVVEHVVRGLEGIASAIARPSGPGVRELANVVHLHTPIAARLRVGAGVADVVSALHPTPAVGGVPSEAALRFLGEHEQLDRGLYAGLVGLVGPGRADLAMALRSALLRGRTARLFVGAGVVEGSSAEGEWVETEMKARALLGALGA